MKNKDLLLKLSVVAIALTFGVHSLNAQKPSRTPAKTGTGNAKPTPTPKATPSSPTTAVGNMTNSFGMKFVAIPAGSFQMGFNTAVTENCQGCAESASEKPVHKVTLSKSFEMHATEVTQQQWLAVMGKNPSENSTCPKCPVENISWADAQEFVAKLNSKSDGFKYRLPTEAEWEYACRAGSTTKYPFGDDAKETGTYAWFLGNQTGKTHEVATKKANAWGLFDMLGNVAEWVEDCWDTYSPKDATDPVISWVGTCSRSIRGGSYYQGAELMRSSHRYSNSPTMRHGSVGLRVVRTK